MSFIFAAFLVASSFFAVTDDEAMKPQESERVIALPEPRGDGDVPLVTAFRKRDSVRSYSSDPLSLAEISQLLWAAQGVTSPSGGRTAPSAGALYPLEIYLVAARVEGVAPGVYRYGIGKHDLVEVASGDHTSELSAAALGQECVDDAAAVIVLTAIYERTTGKYGERGIRYVHMEIGSVAQNVYLQAAALDLGTVFVGAFQDGRVKRILRLPAGEEPLGLMPVGKRE
jgi:SagB-type dehydrogenase family enzyme